MNLWKENYKWIFQRKIKNDFLGGKEYIILWSMSTAELNISLYSINIRKHGGVADVYSTITEKLLGGWVEWVGEKKHFNSFYIYIKLYLFQLAWDISCILYTRTSICCKNLSFWGTKILPFPPHCIRFCSL